MSDHKLKNRKSPGRVILNLFLVAIFLLAIMGVSLAMVFGGSIATIAKQSPDVDPTTIMSSLVQTSEIYDSEGNLLQKVQNPEYEFRTVVTIDQMPQQLIDAFTSIEDERFYNHPGVDIIGIGSAIINSATSGGRLRGASTITQQLVRNMYLTPDRSINRKIMEAYLALQVESKLSKEQILEAYLNKIYLGQGAYGVQEAAQTYFSKNVEDLTIAESALFAGIVQSTSANQPFFRVEKKNYNPDEMISVGHIEVNGTDMELIYNEKSVERQKVVLKQMRKLGKISEEEYQNALNENIMETLKPGQKSFHTMTSYPVDYIQTQAVELLMKSQGLSYSDAQKLVFDGGLRIYSTIDRNIQSKLENIYDDFTEVISGSKKPRAPFLVDWTRDRAKNIIDGQGRIVYYFVQNVFDGNFNFVISEKNYEFKENRDLIIKAPPLNARGEYITFHDVYSINEENNLVTHEIGPLHIPNGQLINQGDGSFIVTKSFLNDNPDVFVVNNDGTMTINNNYFNMDYKGITQPQSASVIIDYKDGYIKGLIGGRGVTGNRILNRATDSKRQPGSSIKPISVYYPSLIEGYTAGSITDDSPQDLDGNPWPRNAYRGYQGPITYRKSLNISSNAGTVFALDELGIEKSKEYLEKLHIIDRENPEKDSFVSAAENRQYNDENLSALALGGMTNGVTPLEMTAAYATIANDGTYIKPRIITRIVDKDGNVLVDETPETEVVSDKQTAYIMKDMLRTVVLDGYTAKNAKLKNYVTAGKTGTTQNQADIWFVGFTPYYAMGTWIGNDSPAIVLRNGSEVASSFWRKISEEVHEGLEPVKEFKEPEGIVKKSISANTGKLASKSSSNIISEIFVEGTEPDEYDKGYIKSVRVCDDTGLLATNTCPNTHNKYQINDSTVLPTKYCTKHPHKKYEPKKVDNDDDDDDDDDDSDKVKDTKKSDNNSSKDKKEKDDN